MDKYQQLQDILNKAIEKGWKPRGGEGNRKITNCKKFCIVENYKYSKSYHELFSKDSGIMEFVEWKRPVTHYADSSTNYEWKKVDNNNNLHTGLNTLPSYDYISEALGKGDEKEGVLQWHYRFMGPMSSDEKIDYFLNNVL